MSIKIYTTSVKGKSSVIVSDDNNEYLNVTSETDELTSLMRGMSYVKNKLTYCNKVIVDTGLPLYQIQMNNYINRMEINLDIHSRYQLMKINEGR